LWKWPWLLPNFNVYYFYYFFDVYYFFNNHIADANTDLLGKPVESMWGRGMDWLYCVCFTVCLFLL
jgi:hypothetical protein